MKRVANSLMALLLVAALWSAAQLQKPVVATFKPTTVTTVIMQAKGFDACTTPTVSQMNSWWFGSPYYTYFPYIGGANRANCGGASVTSSWVASVTGQGWQLVPLWVGPQLPYPACTGRAYNSYISLTTSTAYNQGYAEAQSAVNVLAGLGIPLSSTPPLVYDLEGYNGASACRTAARYFINGWDYFLSTSPAQRSGVYGSTCSSYLSDFATTSTIAHPPNFIYGADFDGNPRTNVMSCISSTYWANHQRDKQYRGSHGETWNGIALSIDNDCVNGPTSGTRTIPVNDGTC